MNNSNRLGDIAIDWVWSNPRSQPVWLTKAPDIDLITSTNNMTCRKCNTKCSFILELVGGAPGFKVEQQSHCIIGHVYLIFSSGMDLSSEFLSLLRKNHSTVREKIYRRLNNKKRIIVEVMYECPY